MQARREEGVGWQGGVLGEGVVETGEEAEGREEGGGWLGGCGERVIVWVEEVDGEGRWGVI